MKPAGLIVLNSPSVDKAQSRTEAFIYPAQTERGGVLRCQVELCPSERGMTVVVGASEPGDLERVGCEFFEVARQIYFHCLTHLRPEQITWKLRIPRPRVRD